MANINEAFPSKYLKPADIGDGQPTVVIKTVEFEAVGQDKEIRPVVYFVGKDKGMVLNKTNATTIATLTGSDETEEWPDFRIRLYSTTTQFQGKTVDTIRVKAAPAAGGKAFAPASVDVDGSDIPF
jgi:hypothetical protein